MKYILVLFLMNLPVLSFALGEIKPRLEKATFAGGCFWCIEAPFDKLEGVHQAISGYTGGHEKHPTYGEVSNGTTGHLEAVQVLYDPEIISYTEILEHFWMQFDPTDDGGSFYDRGSQYTSAIFYHNEEQKKLAEASKKKLEESGIFDKPVVTPIRLAATFYPAEDYHQDYHEKNPAHYKKYRTGSGRDEFIKKIWGKKMSNKQSYIKPADEELRGNLTPLQYQVTQQEGTERPFDNKYWNNNKEGIYVDVVSGEALFSSKDKFKSGTGWPSFTRPVRQENIVEKVDRNFGMSRTELRSKHGDSHLGHLFNDGPAPTGMRYCLNSASLRFIPKEDLEKEGYGEYLRLFE